eukprot:gb/GEZN01017617.1/.p1 GENE.gb/GEZN01017617.1/~~gb/GEZN01017617.1/.p1  ORF type:complete len:261 (+),score=13.95 gb/GEZN01017617.1/:38-784(+)
MEWPVRISHQRLVIVLCSLDMGSSLYAFFSAWMSRHMSLGLYIMAMSCILIETCNFGFAATGAYGAFKESSNLVRAYMRWLVAATAASAVFCIWDVLLVEDKCAYVWTATEHNVLAAGSEDTTFRNVFMRECTKYSVYLSWVLLGVIVFLRLYFVSAVYRFLLYLREKKARHGYYDYSPFSLSTDDETPYQADGPRSVWARSKVVDSPYKHMPKVDVEMSPEHYLYGNEDVPFSPPSPLSEDQRRNSF